MEKKYSAAKVDFTILIGYITYILSAQLVYQR